MTAQEVLERLNLLDENERIEAKRADEIGKSLLENQRCSEDDLVALYQGRQHESFDAGLVPDGTLDDFSPEALADYRQSRRDTNPDAEELRWSDEDLLQALGCVRLNADGKWQPTVAGLVLFGKPVALRRIFPMTRVDYIRVPGREWAPDPERRFDSLELRDPLFRLIRRVQAAILDDLPKAFGLAEGDLQRKDSPIMPQRVIREAVVNALMHRSYRPTGKMLGDDDGLSSNPEGLSRDLGSLSRDPNSLDKAEAERKTKLCQTLLAGLPGELAARVGALGRRSPPDAVRDVVLDLLHQRPWRLEELGQLLQRNPEYVRQKYVQPLLEAARIRMTRPEVPNDPEQAYRAVEERP